MDLEALRGEIDEIDSELVRLFCRRMDTVRAVAQYKSEHGLPVFHPERERKVIEKVSARAGKEYGTGAGVLFQTIMDISKRDVYKRQTPAMRPGSTGWSSPSRWPPSRPARTA